MATNFFDTFPKISYSLDDGDSEQVVVDIFKRALLSKEFQDNSSYFETYEVTDGETPEEVSYRFYGTQLLHWLVLMTNNILDPRYNWPLPEQQLLKHVESKYGGEKNIFTTNKAINKKGYQIETFFVLTEDSTHKNPKRLLLEDGGDTNQPLAYEYSSNTTTFQTNYEIEQLRNESFRNIKILKPSIVQDVISTYSKIINQ
jgi:hypothetical protein